MNPYEGVIKDLDKAIAGFPVRIVVKDSKVFYGLTGEEFDRVVNVLLNTKLTLELEGKGEGK